jgi:CubicO group peptidase (beta-lactamase class C family)
MLPENIELRKRQAPLKEFVSLTLRTPLLFPPASRVSYQSMGILLAAEIVERMTGKPLDAFLQKEVFAPLKMRHSSMGIGHRNIAETVQCDLPSSGDLRMSASDQTWNWNSSYWRKLGVPWGGMHSTVGDIYRLLQAMLDHGSRVLKPELAQAMITDQNKGLNRPWGLGWEVGKEVFFEGSPAKAFGHRGATGTLCWADPDRKLVFVLFTNRPLDNDKDKFLERVAKLVSEAVPEESQNSDG